MSTINSVDRYLIVRDILLYITNAGREVTSSDLLKDVVDCSIQNLNIVLRQMVDAQLIQVINRKSRHFYVPSDSTKDLYGRK
ncbi:hypothetical protein [Acinetobacter soli]|uniref:hypothetical protein n=1 Tax=Acinetobacter soli TaxID=487316 RepID=UPI0012508C0C|nr:hypothetical protein [Acinetobacter soli]MBO3640314.1 hypothetical protein [Acinetobacter soli]MCE6007466.1 hypothetical protein [Acinetobacter soli]